MTNWEMTALILIYILASIALINFTRKLVKREKFNRTDATFPLVIAALIILFVLALAFRQSIEAEEGQITNWVQIFLTFGLVVITSAYAWSAHRQAKANEKMANEMQNQRYDLVRPVIDIQWQPGTHGEIRLMNIVGQLAIAEGQTPQLAEKLTCVLRNVGVGPATDVYSYIQSGTQPDDECHQLRSFGLLPVKGDSGPWPLSLKEMENRKFLIVYYRDIYNRCFQSIREVSRDEKRGNLKLDPLGTSKLPQEIYIELNVGNYQGFLEKLWAYSTTGGKSND